MTHPWRLFDRDDPSRWARLSWTVDRGLLGATVLLIAAGVLLQFGTSPAASRILHHASPFYFAIRQCGFAALGLAVVLSISSLGPVGVRRVAFVIYALAVLAMLALPLLGHLAKGATRWVEFGGFSLQPSEFVKPTLIVLAAWMFAESRKGEIPGVWIAFGLYGLAVAPLVMEPDIGQTALVTAAFGAAFWVAGMPIGWTMAMGAAAAGGLGAAYFIFPHVHARVALFLAKPAAGEPSQAGRAAEAIAAGGAFGRGPGEGTEKAHIPDMHTDFAYSAAAEEYGLLFSLLLIAVFAFLVIRGLQKSIRIADPFEQVAAAGLFSVIGMQAFINVAVNLGLAPTKGMTLPFISYGGSSMLAVSLTAGMALALTRRPSPAPTEPDPDQEGGFFV
jgi:cell division protein FtsW